MTATAATTTSTTTTSFNFPVQPHLYQFTLEEYEAMTAAGILTEEHKVELLFGFIIQKMPITPSHSGTVSLLSYYFFQRFAGKFQVRMENPISLANNSQPEPDCVVVTFRDDFYRSKHPTPADTHLVIEVAQTTLYTDRSIKAAAYADGGITEYWIINLVSLQIEVHLNPDAESKAYADIRQYKQGETFQSPFAGPVAVSDLLP